MMITLSSAGSLNTNNTACWWLVEAKLSLSLIMEDKTLPLVPGKMCVIYIKWTNIPFKLRGVRKSLDCKEGWALKNWCFQIVVLEKTLESPLDCKIKPVNPKGNRSWIFIGMTDAEAEAPILQPPDLKSQHWKRSWCWERLKAKGERGGGGRDG